MKMFFLGTVLSLLLRSLFSEIIYYLLTSVGPAGPGFDIPSRHVAATGTYSLCCQEFFYLSSVFITSLLSPKEQYFIK